MKERVKQSPDIIWVIEPIHTYTDGLFSNVSQEINFFAYGLDFYHLQQKEDLLKESKIA